MGLAETPPPGCWPGPVLAGVAVHVAVAFANGLILAARDTSPVRVAGFDVIESWETAYIQEYGLGPDNRPPKEIHPGTTTPKRGRRAWRMESRRLAVGHFVVWDANIKDCFMV